ncbi:MAG: F0F1 ATP synthase subunit delta, partial [Nitrospiraceae bacterium]
FRTDSSLLSGLHIQMGSTVVDSTIRGRLNTMQALLDRE